MSWTKTRPYSSCTHGLRLPSHPHRARPPADVWWDVEAHPVYRALVEGTDCPEYGDYRMLEHVTAQFKRAAEMNANDGDVSSALGVLCNLSRDYDEVPTPPALAMLTGNVAVRQRRGSSRRCELTRRTIRCGISWARRRQMGAGARKRCMLITKRWRSSPTMCERG